MQNVLKMRSQRRVNWLEFVRVNAIFFVASFFHLHGATRVFQEFWATHIERGCEWHARIQTELSKSARTTKITRFSFFFSLVHSQLFFSCFLFFLFVHYGRMERSSRIYALFVLRVWMHVHGCILTLATGGEHEKKKSGEKRNTHTQVSSKVEERECTHLRVAMQCNAQ